jgi:hypothetical protein
MTEAIAIDLPSEPQSAGRARGELERFRPSLDRDSFVDLRLLASELVAEAVEDASTGGEGIHLQAELRGDRIWIAIAEGPGAYLLPSTLPEPGEQGWGVHLVQRLSSRWGVSRGPKSASVWLEMPLSPAPA